MRSNTNEKQNTTEEFVEGVITEAKKSFQPGREQIKNDLNTIINNGTLPATRKDKRFLRDAHWLHDTNFVAASGPRSEAEMANFITDTIYNQYCPINQVIALGHCLAYTQQTYQDFHDYIIKERQAVFGQYHVNIKRLSGNATTTESAHQVFPYGVLHSQLQIKAANSTKEYTETLNVTLIALDDNQAIDLRNKKFEPLKKILLQHFLQSLKTPVLVHCAFGLGRTGHLILMFEILKYHTHIFAEDSNPIAAAAKIQHILNEMRASRPGLVLTEQQFECAIRNAKILHVFALENECTINTQQAVRTIPLPFFSNRIARTQSAEKKHHTLKT